MNQAELNRLMIRGKKLQGELYAIIQRRRGDEILVALSGLCYELGTLNFKSEAQADEYAEAYELLGARLLASLAERDDQHISCETDLDILLVISGMFTELVTQGVCSNE